MSFLKLEKFLIGLLIFLLIVVLGEQAFLLYQKGYFKSGLFKTFKTISQPKSEEKSNNYRKIILSSEVSGYNLEFKNEAKLEELLTKIGFWEKDKVSLVMEPSIFIQPQGLEIILVANLNDYYWCQKTKDNEIITAINVEGDEGKNAQIKIYLNKQELEENLNEPTRLDQMILFGLYGLSPKMREKAPYRQGTNAIFQMLKNDYGDYFGLVKLVAGD